MADPDDTLTPPAPSRRMLLKSAILTFLLALVVTVLFVLPAEYGVDPTGAGQALGLTAMGRAAAPEIDATPTIVSGSFPPIPAEEDFDYYEPEVLADPFSRSHAAPFRSDTIVIDIDEFEHVEYKAFMKQGDAFVYSWRLTKGNTVYTDFHADPDGNPAYPERYYVRYAESEDPKASGSLVAPFDGHHGWYWMNIEEQPVQITLEVRGFYEGIEELMRAYQ